MSEPIETLLPPSRRNNCHFTQLIQRMAIVMTSKGTRYGTSSWPARLPTSRQASSRSSRIPSNPNPIASFTPRSLLPERSFFTDVPILNSCSCFTCRHQGNSDNASQSSWHFDQLHIPSCYGVSRHIDQHDGSCSFDTPLTDTYSIQHLAPGPDPPILLSA